MNDILTEDDMLVSVLAPVVFECDFGGEFFLSPREYSEISDSSEEAASILNSALENTKMRYFRNIIQNFSFRGYCVIITFSKKMTVADIWKVLDFMERFIELIPANIIEEHRKEIMKNFLVRKMNEMFGMELEGKADYVCDFCCRRFGAAHLTGLDLWEKIEFYCMKYTKFLLQTYGM